MPGSALCQRLRVAVGLPADAAEELVSLMPSNRDNQVHYPVRWRRCYATGGRLRDILCEHVNRQGLQCGDGVGWICDGERGAEFREREAEFTPPEKRFADEQTASDNLLVDWWFSLSCKLA